jgi:hypothetical protein
LHIQSHFLEVIAFQEKSTKEYSRIYFDEEKLLAKIGSEVLEGALNDYITEASNQRFKESLPPKTILMEEIKRRILSSHILSNLHLELSSTPTLATGTNAQAEDHRTLVYHPPDPSESSATTTPPLAKDLIPLSEIVYDTQPKDVIPVFITRRRHSSTEEIQSTVNEINVLQEDIRDLTRQAEILGSLITIGAMLFMKEGGNRRQRLEAGKYSLPKRRWKSAMQQVLKQGRVAKTRAYLDKIQFH